MNSGVDIKIFFDSHMPRSARLALRNKIRSKEGDYPVPGLAYFPVLPLKKKAPAIPPKIAAAIADAPSTPPAGLPDDFLRFFEIF